MGIGEVHGIVRPEVIGSDLKYVKEGGRALLRGYPFTDTALRFLGNCALRSKGRLASA